MCLKKWRSNKPVALTVVKYNGQNDRVYLLCSRLWTAHSSHCAPRWPPEECRWSTRMIRVRCTLWRDTITSRPDRRCARRPSGYSTVWGRPSSTGKLRHHSPPVYMYDLWIKKQIYMCVKLQSIFIQFEEHWRRWFPKIQNIICSILALIESVASIHTSYMYVLLLITMIYSYVL